MSDSEHSTRRASPVDIRQRATPNIESAWRQFSAAIFEAGALSIKHKQLIAVAVAHVTQCPHCIRAHVRSAQSCGASENELAEAVWVAAEMRAGAAVAHSSLAFSTWCQEHDGLIEDSALAGSRLGAASND